MSKFKKTKAKSSKDLYVTEASEVPLDTNSQIDP